MSEKRFIVLPNNVVWDNQLNEVVCRCILEGIGDAENVCQRLNEQQATIQSLKEENEKLKITLSEYGVDFSSLDRFKEAIGYNEMVKKVLK